MIPLRIKVEMSSQVPPFVARLCRTAAEALDSHDAVLEREADGVLQYQSSQGLIRLLNVSAADLEGDVLLVVPARGIAHRLIRAASRHNSLLVTERCDQLCVMCSQPPKKGHVDLFPFFEQAVRLAPPNAVIGITGGEPTLFKDELFTLLRRSAEARPDLRFHVLTNGQHFLEEDAQTLRDLRGKVIWGIPLYAPSSPLHDSVVAKEGAFDRLRQSLGTLARGGAEIELRTVVMATNVEMLTALARHIVTHTPFISFWAIMQLENIGYGRKNWNELFFDNSRDFSPIGAAVDIARARGIKVSLYNFPLCTVPEAYRAHAVASISDWKRRYLPKCEECAARQRCGGFFEWYPEARGFAEVGLQ